MHVIVVHNPTAGILSGRRHTAAARSSAVREAFAAHGVEADVRDARDVGLLQTARVAAAAKADAVIAAGGDGTVNAVASALLGVNSAVPLGVLPLGTLNHFARDLGIPPSLPQAVAVVAHGHTRRVDVGQVNGHYFLNNSSIGLYPQIVRHRDRQREQLGRGKWIAMLVATLAIFRRYPHVRVVLDLGDGATGDTGGRQAVRYDSPFVFVGNNRYEMDLFAMGTRRALDRGELSLYVARGNGRLALLRLAFLGLFGRLQQARDFDARVLSTCRIETRKRRLRVAVDGEVLRVHPPLEYRVAPGQLLVLAPVSTGTGSR